mmetsp:Transcript_47664/g.158892  ORF Transcript_47664/g.158892 Transcript_47664/m.158892 type:complete len:471 (-) Transcript_47664:421-1833(-)
MDVDLRPVKGAVARVEGPSAAALCLVLVERLRDHRLGGLPHRGVAKRALGLGREVERKVHPEPAVDGRDHVEHVGDLLLDLRDHAKDVRVVLLEAAHAREAGERARELVAVQHAEVGHAEGQLAVGALAVLEEHAMGGAVHRLEAKLLPLDVEQEHVLLVLGGVARRLPQLEVEDVWGDDLVVVALEVLGLDHIHQLVVDARAVRQEEARAGRDLVEEEELLLQAEPAVVAFRCLLLKSLPCPQLLLVWEGNAVHALQLVVARLAEPERGRRLRDGEGLHLARVWEVWATAEVDKGAGSVDCGRGAVGQLGLDDCELEWVLSEEGLGFGLCDDDALEGLLGVADLLDALLELLVHLWPVRVAAEERVVKEAGLQRRSMRELRRVEALESLAQHVRRRVPEGLLAGGLVPLVQPQLAIALERPLHIPHLPLCRRGSPARRLVAVGVDDPHRPGVALGVADRGDAGGRGEAL